MLIGREGGGDRRGYAIKRLPGKETKQGKEGLGSRCSWLEREAGGGSGRVWSHGYLRVRSSF